MANIKRLDEWWSFWRCMYERLTVRSSASRLGIHQATAFRWRHRLLDAARARDHSSFTGDVAMDEICFPESHKGSRSLNRPARRRTTVRGSGEARWLPAVVVLDTRGRIYTHLPPPGRSSGLELGRLLMSRLKDVRTVIACRGALSAAAGLASAYGVDCVSERSRCRPWRLRVLEYSNRLYGWLRPFRGVATRYLPNYLVWHRLGLGMVDLGGMVGCQQLLRTASMEWNVRYRGRPPPTVAGVQAPT